MKGTLLLLAFLVIGELGFRTAEACVPFFGIYSKIVSGSSLWLKKELSFFEPTEEEKAAFQKIQDCYKEAGFKAKLQDAKFMKSLLLSTECKTYYGDQLAMKIKNGLSKIWVY
ncbi:secretoglobin family 2B member 2-like [Grammomys surdaster]|uniref:secretoglobin family 2B member 2-like n=1 Tax=Grammomys surdaster TaxID=491861 RepID=UPI00109FFFD7|nr:secretoglobin family 2B member 2-like [Grammomys surdaster]